MLSKQLLWLGFISIAACGSFLYCVLAKEYYYAAGTIVLWTIIAVIFLLVMKKTVRR